MDNKIQKMIDAAHSAGWMITVGSWKDGKWRCHLSKHPEYASAVGGTLAESLEAAIENSVVTKKNASVA